MSPADPSDDGGDDSVSRAATRSATRGSATRARRASPIVSLVKRRSGFDPSQPRDHRGRWVKVGALVRDLLTGEEFQVKSLTPKKSTVQVQGLDGKTRDVDPEQLEVVNPSLPADPGRRGLPLPKGKTREDGARHAAAVGAKRRAWMQRIAKQLLEQGDLPEEEREYWEGVIGGDPSPKPSVVPEGEEQAHWPNADAPRSDLVDVEVGGVTIKSAPNLAEHTTHMLKVLDKFIDLKKLNPDFIVDHIPDDAPRRHRSANGLYSPKRNVLSLNRSLIRRGGSPAATGVMLHEFAHWLDFKRISEREGYSAAEEREPIPIVKQWRSAVINTYALNRLYRLSKGPKLVKWKGGYAEVDKRHLKYLLSGSEVFARSFAQWAYMRGNPGAAKRGIVPVWSWLDEYKRKQLTMRQWALDDFDDVMTAFEKMALEYGWLK